MSGFDAVKKASSTVQKKVTGVSSEIEIDVSKIKPNPEQPRKIYDYEKEEFFADDGKLHVEELNMSIEKNGLLNAINVKAVDDGFLIVAGECRWLAHKLYGKTHIRCNIINADDKKIMELSFVENTQRKSLTPYEEAVHIIKMWQTGFYKKKSDLLEAIGRRDESYISKCLSVLKLDGTIIEDLMDRKSKTSIEVLYELSTVKDHTLQVELYGKGSTREEIRDAKKEYKAPPSSPALKSYHFRESDDIQDVLDAIKECGSCTITIKEIVEIKQNNGGTTEEK